LSAPREQIRIVVCDDAPEVCELTRLILERDPGLSVVGVAGDGEAAVELIAALLPDVAILDLAMPKVDGLAALLRVRAVSPATGVIVLSGFAARRLAGVALAHGADRYLEKGGPADRIREAVYEVA
jgi:two-component system, chemotaxis family, chemotaxis protein CheY